MKTLYAFSIALAAVVAGPAISADVSIPYKAPPPAIVTGGGFYAWVDGFYDRIRLPTYAEGFHNMSGLLGDTGPVNSFDPRLNGGSVRGAVGYQVPGSSFRVEVGGSYIAGSGSLTQQALNSGAPGSSVGPVMLNGFNPFGLNCPCSTSGMLNTSYNAWQVNGKAAYDLRYGSLTVTPFAALFGGNSENKQTLSQTMTQVLGGFVATYNANTSVRWDDVGGRVGLDVNVAVNNALAIGIGGWIGATGRNTSLSGTDQTTGLESAATAISLHDTTTAFLANAEAGFAHTLTPTITVRGFVGINYDNKVPGITIPTFLPHPGAAISVPVGINYSHETSYYAGAGLIWNFSGPLLAVN
jgi:hypothetical protein